MTVQSRFNDIPGNNRCRMTNNRTYLSDPSEDNAKIHFLINLRLKLSFL